MNNFSSYQGLPNLSYIVADDLDIANLEVDTLTVNTQLKTNSIEPKNNNSPVILYSAQTSTCSIGNSLNVNPIVFNQDIESDNITANTQLNTNSIQPLTNNSNLVIGLGTNTGIIDIQQDVDIDGDLESDNIIVNTELNTNSIQPLNVNDIVNLYTTNTNAINIGNPANLQSININQQTAITGDTYIYNRLGINTTYDLTTTGSGLVVNNPSNEVIIKFISEPSDAVKLFLLRGDYDFGADSNTDWLVQNDLNGYFKIESGLNGFTYNYITAGDDEFYINNQGGVFIPNSNLEIGNTYGLFSNFIRPILSNITLDIGESTYSSIISLNQNTTLLSNKTFKANLIEPTATGTALTLFSTGTSTCNFGNTANTNIIRFNQRVSIGTNSNTRQLNVSNEQDTSVSNYLQLLNTNHTSRENGIHIRNQNAGVFANEWFLYTPANSTDFRFYYTADRFSFTNSGVLKLTTLTGTATGTQFSLGESGDIGSIACNRTMIYSANKGIIMNATGGLIQTNNIQGITSTASITLFQQTTGAVNMCSASTTGSINLLNGTTTGAVNVLSNLFVGTDAVQKGIACAYYQAYAVGNLVRLFPTTSTGDIRLGEVQTSGNIQIGHTTPASDLGTLNINKNTVLATGKSLTFSTTSDLKVNSIQPINVGDTTNIMTTSTAQINIGNPASISALSISNTISMASGKNIFLANTNQRIECNNFESFTNSNPVEMYRLLTGTFKIGNSANTNNIEFNQNVSLTSKKLLCLTYTSTSTSNFMNQGESGDSGIINVYRDTYFQNKTLYIDSISALTPTASSLGLYQNATTSDITIGSSQTSGYTTLGGTVATSGTVRLQPNTEIAFDKILYVSTLNYSNYKGSGTTIQLYNDITTTGSVNIMSAQTTAHLNLGNASATTGRIKLLNPNIESGAVGTNISLYGNTTTGSVSIMGGQSTGNLNLGNASATTGRIKFLNSSIESNAVSSTTNLFNNQTTGNIVCGSAITSGKIILGNTSASPPTNDGSVQTNGVLRILNNASSFFNTNSGTNLFRTVALQGKQLTTTMWAAAPTSVFAVWESNADNEACFIAQNGDSSIISNPGDQSALWYVDEDVITTANNWGWVGFRMSTAGVITASSDRRIKRDIQPIVKENLLETLSKIQIVNYKLKPPRDELYYKDGVLRRKYQETHMGVVAQQLRDIGIKEVVDRENEEAYWTVKYQDLSYYFHLGTQELIKENIKLKEENTLLKERMDKMENFIKSKFNDYI